MSENSVITLDASKWKTKEDFYDSYSIATNAPIWFGRNLSAFADSLRGGICKTTPEKIIISNFTKKVKNYLGDEFIATLNTICAEEEVILEIYVQTFPVYASNLTKNAT